MPETIALPTIEKPANTSVAVEPTPTVTTAPLKSPIAHIFEEALKSGNGMNTGEEPPKPAEPETPITNPPKTATPEPAPPPAPAPAFELPPEITGTPEPTSADDVKVEDLIPEQAPEWAKSDKQKQDLKKWRDNQLRLQQKLERAEGELKKRPEVNGDAAAQIKELEGRCLELSNVVEELGITRHPAFQSQFIKPKTEAITQAKALLKEVNLDPESLERALNVTGQARREAFDELAESITSPSARMEFVDLKMKIQDSERKQEAALSDRQNWLQQEDQRMRAQRHQEAQVQLTQIRGMVDAAVDGLRDQAGFTVLKKIDGNEKWNTHVDAMIDSAKKLMTETTNPMELAANAVMGQLTPLYFKAFQSEQSRRIAAEKELAEARGATPSLNGSGAGAGAGDTPTEERTGVAAIVDRITKSSTNPFGSN